jgi:hypothetical protein
MAPSNFQSGNFHCSTLYQRSVHAFHSVKHIYTIKVGLSELGALLLLSQPNSNTKRSWGDHILQWNPPPPPTHPTQTCKALPDDLGS